MYLFSSTTLLTGSAPWKVGDFALNDGESVSITAYGLASGDKVCIEQVLKVQAGSGDIELDGCGIKLPDDEVTTFAHQLKDGTLNACICSAHPWVKLDSARFPQGNYRLSVTGSSFSAGTARVVMSVGKSQCCDQPAAFAVCA